MNRFGDHGSSLGNNLQEKTGCSRLCVALAGIGIAMTTTASLFTYRALHGPLEAVGASVVHHLASSSCTALARTLAGLSVAYSDALATEQAGERTATDATTVLGVVTPGTWQLEDYHATTLTQGEARSILQRLPPEALITPLKPQRPPGDTNLLASHHCTPLGYGLNPDAVRVFRIADPTHGSEQHRGESTGDWLAFVYGPFSSAGQQKSAFALVNLRSATLGISGHEHGLGQFFPAGDGRLAMAMDLHPRAVLTQGDQLSLGDRDEQLAALKMVPFSNQVVSSRFSIDHHELDRVSGRTAGFVFLFGLLATTSVVLVSRRSEVQLRALNRNLLRESRTDGLTRVANRRAWDEALTMEENRRQRYGHRYGLVVVDLDGFKQINDRQGHPRGDAVLQQTAQLLLEELRSTDLVARVGGDEFVALVFNPDARGLHELVQRLQQRLADATIAASIGSALSEESTSLDQTWAQADAAMYAVKAATRA
jgi:diguanylate cyclase (GGDEF)-like protein